MSNERTIDEIFHVRRFFATGWHRAHSRAIYGDSDRPDPAPYTPDRVLKRMLKAGKAYRDALNKVNTTD